MPLINLPFDRGMPLIRASVGVSAPRQAALAASGRPVPQAVVLTLLIDTGASNSCVDPIAVASLGLSPTGNTTISTPSTGSTPLSCNLYDISLSLRPSVGIPFLVEALPVIEAQMRNQGLDGLLGRDVLAQCTLFYNGGLKGYTLAY